MIKHCQWAGCVLLIVLVTACKSSNLLPDAGPDEQILFQDDFSESSSGWSMNPGISGISEYADGVYQLKVDTPYANLSSVPGLTLEDVKIEVDAIRVGGDRNNRFGVLCRMTGPDKYYAFLISSDGYFGIGKVNGSSYQLLGAETMLPSNKIPLGTEYLHLRADCIKDRLVLYVNGKMVHEAYDNELIFGDVGLIAGNYEQPGTQIYFDNFSVYIP